MCNYWITKREEVCSYWLQAFLTVDQYKGHSSNMYKFKIEKIHFNIEMGKMEFVPKSVNIIVGSNNAGKSRILKELRDFFSGDHNDLKIIDKVEYSFPKTFSDFNEEFELDTKVANDKYGNYFLKAYNNPPFNGHISSKQPLLFGFSIEERKEICQGKREKE